ncbi:hypothetical protein VTN49DRAFT_4885 [Thermomyces lanuginosus]|uniref:uncharacterized protein n=1 Tax=Thermomyces lanuginosus TaxID=5541 RepID=UPI003743A0B6
MQSVASRLKRVIGVILDSNRDNHADQALSQQTTEMAHASDMNHDHGGEESPARAAPHSTTVEDSGEKGNTRRESYAFSPSKTPLATQAPVCLQMPTSDAHHTLESPKLLRMSHKQHSNMLLSRISRSSTKSPGTARGGFRDTPARRTSSPVKDSVFSNSAVSSTPERRDAMETENVRQKEIGFTPRSARTIVRTPTPNVSSREIRMTQDAPTTPKNSRFPEAHEEYGSRSPSLGENHAIDVEPQQVRDIVSLAAKENTTKELRSPQNRSPAHPATTEINAKVTETPPQRHNIGAPIEEANEVIALGDLRRRESVPPVHRTSGALDPGIESDVGRRNDTETPRTLQRQELVSPVALEKNRVGLDVDAGTDAAAPSTPQGHHAASLVALRRNTIELDIGRGNDAVISITPRRQKPASPVAREYDVTSHQAPETAGFNTGQSDTVIHGSSRRQRLRPPDTSDNDTNRSVPAQSGSTSTPRGQKQKFDAGAQNPWQGMTSIRRKDIRIPKDQRKLLDEDCWIPAEPGQPTPQGHAPLNLIQRWNEQIIRLRKGQGPISESTPEPQLPLADPGMPTVASSEALSEDGSESESSAFTWSPSPVPERAPPQLPLDSSPLQRAEREPDARSVASPRQRDSGHGRRNTHDPPMSSINGTPSRPQSVQRAESLSGPIETSSLTQGANEEYASSQRIQDHGLQDDSGNESGMGTLIPPFDQPVQDDPADEVSTVGQKAVSSQHIQDRDMQDGLDDESGMDTSIPLAFEQPARDDLVGEANDDADEMSVGNSYIVPQSVDKVQILDTPWQESTRYAERHNHQDSPRAPSIHEGSPATAKTSSQPVIANSYDSNGNPVAQKKPHVRTTGRLPVRASDGAGDDDRDASIPSHQPNPLSHDIVPDSSPWNSTQMSSLRFPPSQQLADSQAAENNAPRVPSPEVTGEAPAVSQKRKLELLGTDQPATKRQKTFNGHEMDREVPPCREAEDREEGNENVEEGVDKPHQVYNKFKRDYPCYEGDFTHFARMCFKLQALRKCGLMLKSFLWDDFIIQHLLHYEGYVQSCLRAVEKPKPYESYFCDTFTRPEYRKRSLSGPAIELLASQCKDPVTVDIPGANRDEANQSFAGNLAGRLEASKVSLPRHGNPQNKQARQLHMEMDMERGPDRNHESDASEPVTHLSSSVNKDGVGSETRFRDAPMLPEPPSSTASQAGRYSWQLTLEESREANLSALTEILQMPLSGPIEPGWAADPDTPFKVWARRHENLLSEKRRRGWTPLRVGRDGVIQPEQYIPLDWGYNLGWKWPSRREDAGDAGDRRSA